MLLLQLFVVWAGPARLGVLRGSAQLAASLHLTVAFCTASACSCLGVWVQPPPCGTYCTAVLRPRSLLVEFCFDITYRHHEALGCANAPLVVFRPRLATTLYPHSRTLLSVACGAHCVPPQLHCFLS